MQRRTAKWFILGVAIVPLSVGGALALAQSGSQADPPTVRSVDNGNPMAPLGLDCKGGEAGVTDNFGAVGVGAPSALDAAVAEFGRMPDLAAAAKKGKIVEVASTEDPETIATPETNYVLTDDAGVVAARVSVFEFKSEWYVSGLANCVAPYSSSDAEK